MPTIKDVAKRAGVSTGTVSMVLNGSKSVKMETRYRVLEVVKEMGYVPNQYARSLVTHKKNVIGVIRQKHLSLSDGTRSGYRFDEVPDTYLSDMLDDIVHELSAQGYSLLLDTAAWTQGDDAHSVPLPAIAQAGRIDGLIWAGGFLTDAQKEQLQQLSIPVVTVGSRSDVFDFVDTDPEEGMYLMTRHILSQGHRQIACILGPATSQTSARKQRGMERALLEYGLNLADIPVRQSSYSGLGGYHAMQRIWESNSRPTAVITALDILAAGAMRFLQEMHLRIPQDISVAGYEDGLLAENMTPALTTVCTHKEKLGLNAARILTHRIEHPTAQQVKLIIPPQIIVRQSVQPI